jgi:hypothetical protein
MGSACRGMTSNLSMTDSSEPKETHAASSMGFSVEILRSGLD